MDSLTQGMLEAALTQAPTSDASLAWDTWLYSVPLGTVHRCNYFLAFATRRNRWC